MPRIRVLKRNPLGEEWSRGEMEWYGIVRVQVGRVTFDVGACIGVPESERGSCAASAAGIRPYLTAWYSDITDWESAPAKSGSTGVPKELASDVIAAIGIAAPRLARAAGL